MAFVSTTGQTTDAERLRLMARAICPDLGLELPLGVARSTFDLAGAVMFSLFVLVGSGLIVDSAVLMPAAAGLAGLIIFCTLLAALWRRASPVGTES